MMSDPHRHSLTFRTRAFAFPKKKKKSLDKLKDILEA